MLKITQNTNMYQSISLQIGRYLCPPPLPSIDWSLIKAWEFPSLTNAPLRTRISRECGALSDNSASFVLPHSVNIRWSTDPGARAPMGDRNGTGFLYVSVLWRWGRNFERLVIFGGAIVWMLFRIITILQWQIAKRMWDWGWTRMLAEGGENENVWRERGW